MRVRNIAIKKNSKFPWIRRISSQNRMIKPHELADYSFFFLLYSFPLRFIAGHRIQFCLLYSSTLLFIHSLYDRSHLLTPTSPSLPQTPPPWQPRVCSLCPWVCFCFIGSFVLDSTYKWYHMVFVFLFLTSLSMIISSSIHVAANGIISFLFCGWVVLHCTYVPHLIYPFICRWTFRLFPCLSYCE